MAKSKIIKGLVTLFMASYLIASCFALKAKAEDVTTGNLLPNVGDGVDWGSSSTEQINPGGSGYVSNGTVVNGFTVTCATSQANCGYKWSVGGDFEVTGTATLSVDDIALTNTDRTQDMLDNGITINNYIDVANCDHEAGNCEGDTGATDSHTITIEIKDSSGVVKSTTTQTRTDIDGFKGNCNGYPTNSTAGVSAACGQYNDTVIFNSTGANKLDWAWSGTDNNTGSASRGGPNLLGAKLTMTYDNTVISTEASTALDVIEEVLEDLQTEVFEEFIFEEETFAFNEEPQFEMEVEMEMETNMGDFTFSDEFFDEFFEEEFYFEEEMSFEDGPMLTFTDDEMMEEIYEETNELVETFLPMVSEEEEFSSEETFTTETFEEEMIEEEPPTMTETFEEEESTEMAETFEEEPTEMAEEEAVEEESTEMAEEETIEEESTEMVEAEDEETVEEEAQEEESPSETTTASAVSSEKAAEQKKIQQEKAIVANIERVMDKVDRDIKDIAKNLAIKNIIKLNAIASEQASLELYKNAIFYTPEDIYLRQLNIFDPRQIYPNTNLASYTQNDKIEIKDKKLNEIKIKKQRLLIELEQLKNG
jgi:chemotaxis protein histidine kinase CheA